MIFTEPRFLLFFLVALAVHWSLRPGAARKLWLLGCSYGFYAAWDWRFLGLIVVSTTVDFVAGARIERARSTPVRKAWLTVSITANLGLLFFFKYFGFFLESAQELASWLGLPFTAPGLRIVLPVGISFYTFQTLSYTLDVYRGQLKATRSPVDFALFVAFFPQLVAGPIVRARTFLPQLEMPRSLGQVDWKACLVLFCLGFFKKACVANGLEAWLEPAFRQPESLGLSSAWWGIVGFSVQIYCDFSGYSDMAVAGAGMLGYRLPENFRAPYLARDPSDFWRRWHISLSTWMRDYVYTPLGGNHGGRWRELRNLWITFLAVGLWHGASWNMVAFGAVHALGVSVPRLLRSLRTETPRVAGLARRAGSVVGTFAWVSLAWPVFQCEDLAASQRYFGVLLGVLPGSGAVHLPWMLPAVLLVLAILHGAVHAGWLAALVRRSPGPLFAAGLGFAAALCLALARAPSQPFLYFQF